MTPKGDPAVWLSYLALVAVGFGVMRRAPEPSTIRPIPKESPAEQILSETRVPARLWQDPIQVGWERIRSIKDAAGSGEEGAEAANDKLWKLWSTERKRIDQSLGNQHEVLIRELALKNWQAQQRLRRKQGYVVPDPWVAMGLISMSKGDSPAALELQPFIIGSVSAWEAWEDTVEISRVAVLRDLSEKGLLEWQEKEGKPEELLTKLEESIDGASAEVTKAFLKERARDLVAVVSEQVPEADAALLYGLLDEAVGADGRIDPARLSFAIDAFVLPNWIPSSIIPARQGVTGESLGGKVVEAVEKFRGAIAELVDDPHLVRRTIVDWLDQTLAAEAAQSSRTVAEIQEEFRGLDAEKKLLVLPIVVSGSAYPEAREDRLRARYALGAAMKHCGYTPMGSSYVDFFPVPIRKSDGGVVPANSPKPDASRVEYVPVTREVYRKTKSGGGSEGEDVTFMVFWIDSRLCGLAGKKRYGNVQDAVGAVIRAGGLRFAKVDKCMTLLGSDDLAAVLKAGSPPKGLQLWFPRSSATLEELKAEAEIESVPDGFDIYRTTPSDRRLMETLAAEMMMRATPGPGGPGRLPVAWFIAEHDTLYSRSMFKVFKSELENSGYLEESEGESDRLRHVSYLRGLDGNLPDTVTDESRKPAAVPNSISALIENLMAPSDGKQPVFGRRQVDYMQRLAHSLREGEMSKPDGQRVKAICVMGSDVFDKLMILQSFRPLFPDAVFYTTGLDALYLHPDSAVAARNLVVIAPYGLESETDRKLDGISHSFRDSGQTAVFEAIVEYVGKADGTAINEKILCRPMGIWEVGRTEFHPLLQRNEDWHCWTPMKLSETEETASEHAENCPLHFRASEGAPPAAQRTNDPGGVRMSRFALMLGVFVSALSIPFIAVILAARISKQTPANQGGGYARGLRGRGTRALAAIKSSAGLVLGIMGLAVAAILVWSLVPGGVWWKTFTIGSTAVVLALIAAVWIKSLAKLKPLAPFLCKDAEERARLFGVRVVWLSFLAWLVVCGYMLYRASLNPEEPLTIGALFDGVSVWLTSIIRFGAAFFGLAALLRMSRDFALSGQRLGRETSAFAREEKLTLFTSGEGKGGDRAELTNRIQEEVGWYVGGGGRGFYRVPTYILLSWATSLALLLATAGISFVTHRISTSLLIPARGELAFRWSMFAFLGVMVVLLALVAVALVQHILLCIFLSRLRTRMELTSKKAGRPVLIPAEFAEALSEHADAVSRFVVVPFAVMVFVVASRHAIFDGWSMPSSMWFALGVMLLAILVAAFALHRQAAELKAREKRRIVRAKRGPSETPEERAADLWDDQVGIFGSWRQQPVVRALLIVAAGVGITFMDPLFGM